MGWLSDYNQQFPVAQLPAKASTGLTVVTSFVVSGLSSFVDFGLDLPVDLFGAQGLLITNLFICEINSSPADGFFSGGCDDILSSSEDLHCRLQFVMKADSCLPGFTTLSISHGNW